MDLLNGFSPRLNYIVMATGGVALNDGGPKNSGEKNFQCPEGFNPASSAAHQSRLPVSRPCLGAPGENDGFSDCLKYIDTATPGVALDVVEPENPGTECPLPSQAPSWNSWSIQNASQDSVNNYSL